MSICPLRTKEQVPKILVSHFNLEMLLFLNLKFQELSVLGEVDLFFFSLLSVTSSRDLKRRNSQLQLNIFHLIFVPILSGRTVTLPFPTVAQTKSFLCWSLEAGMLLLFLTILTIFWGLSLTSSKSLKLFIVSNSFWDWLFILSKGRVEKQSMEFSILSKTNPPHSPSMEKI